MKTIHRLTWRMYCAVYIEAESREEAIRIALATKPAHIPAGTELHYGLVGSSASAIKRLPGRTVYLCGWLPNL